MPPVAAAVAASVTASAISAGVIGSSLFAAQLVYGATYLVTSAAMSVATSALMNGLMGKPKPTFDAPSFSSEALSRSQMVRSPVAQRTVVYGQAMTSGPLALADVTGSKNKRLHLVVPVAGHEIDGFDEVYLNDVAVGLGSVDADGWVQDGKYANKVRIKTHLGAADQLADPDLVEEYERWTEDHRLRGIAYMYLAMDWDPDVYPGGLPNPKALIRGRKHILDPRTDATGYTDNFALHVRDYLVGRMTGYDDLFGLGCDDYELDDDKFIEAANISDELVALAAGGTQKRYTSGGIIRRDTPLVDAMGRLLSAGSGVLPYQQGKYHLFPAAATVAGPTLTASDLRAAIRIRPRQRRKEVFNAVAGTFVDPDDGWRPTDFPKRANATYKAEDGEERIREIELPFTSNKSRAQRLANIALEQGRQPMIVDFPGKLSVMAVGLWNVVNLDIVAPSGAKLFDNKPFRVIEYHFSEDAGVDLVLREESSAAYDWVAGQETTIDPAPNSSLPDPWEVGQPGAPEIQEGLYETREGAGVKSKVTVASEPSADAYVEIYRFEYRLVGVSAWTVLPDQRVPEIELKDFAPGTYEFHCQAISTLGIGSAYSPITRKEILGLALPPAQLQGLTLSAAGGLVVLRWTQAAELDVRDGGQIEFRHAQAQTGADITDSVSIGEAVPGDATVAVLPLKAGTYFARAVDATPTRGPAASVSTKAATVLTYTSLGTVVEHPVFSGTHAGTFVDGTDLKLAGATNIDSWTSIDAQSSIDYVGGVRPSGTYSFATVTDLGSVQRVRLTANVVARVVNDLDRIDQRLGTIDTWESIDGNVPSAADVQIWVSATDDDPAGSPTWSAFQRLDSAEFEARAFKYEARLASTDPSINSHVSQLGVSIERVA